NAFLLDHSVQALTAQLAMAKAEAASQRRTDAAEISRLNRAIASSEETTARSDDKIRRMRESFSWRATGPLRAVRRGLFDRPAQGRSAAETGPSPTAPAAEDGWHFHHHI